MHNLDYDNSFPIVPLNPYKSKVNLNRLISGRAGYIDIITDDGNFITIQGWSLCLDAIKIELPRRLLLLDGENLIGNVSFNVERPDVISEFGLSDFLLCGFQFVIPTTKVESKDMVELLAEDSQGNLYQLIRIKRCGLQLELTGKCNLRCPMCPSVSYSNFHKQEMNRDDLKLIRPLFHKIDNMCFDGFGESLLSEYFDDFIQAVPRLKELNFHTNGVLLNNKVDILLDNSPPLRTIIVSLDSLKDNVYAQIRRGSTLGKVISNIHDFIKTRKSRGQHYPLIVPNITIMKVNYDELEAFVRLAADLDGIVEFNYLYDSTNMDDNIIDMRDWNFNYEEQKPKNISPEINDKIRESMCLAETMNVRVQFSGSFAGLLSETSDEYGYAGETINLKDCQYMHPYYMLQADGRFQYCVWQTSPIYDWRTTQNIDPLKDSRGKRVYEMIKQGVIPYECSGAGCIYVGRKISKELAVAKNSDNIGGFSGVKRS